MYERERRPDEKGKKERERETEREKSERQRNNTSSILFNEIPSCTL